MTMSIETLKASLDSAVEVRTASNGTFYAIPQPDGTYMGVKAWALSSTDVERKNGTVIPAFNFDEAVANQREFAQKQAEKASKPKTTTKTVNEEAQKHRDELDAAVIDYFANVLPADANVTATEVWHSLFPNEKTVMAVGSSLHRVAEKGLITMNTVAPKKYTYSPNRG